MTDPAMRDPEKNIAYYASNTRYEDNRSRFEEPRVRWAAARAGKAKRVLDVACNDGFFAELLPPGVEYDGIEINKVAVEHAYPRAKGRILCADFMAVQKPVAAYDCIVAMEVLEHLVDPDAAVRLLWWRLEPGGFVIATSATGRDEKEEPGNRDHLREWSPGQFRDLFSRNGFRVKELVLAEVYRGRFTTCVLAEKPSASSS